MIIPVIRRPGNMQRAVPLLVSLAVGALLLATGPASAHPELPGRYVFNAPASLNGVDVACVGFLLLGGTDLSSMSATGRVMCTAFDSGNVILSGDASCSDISFAGEQSKSARWDVKDDLDGTTRLSIEPRGLGVPGGKACMRTFVATLPSPSGMQICTGATTVQLVAGRYTGRGRMTCSASKRLQAEEFPLTRVALVECSGAIRQETMCRGVWRPHGGSIDFTAIPIYHCAGMTLPQATRSPPHSP